MNRNARACLGQETVEIVQRGWYDSPGGGRVDLSPLVSRCLASTTFYRPSQLDEIVHRTAPCDAECKTSFEVVNDTSLSASRRLVSQHGGSMTLCLNFASAKNPGGGFLGGSQAQEESLARSSGLYASLLSQAEYYEVNRACRTALYTDHMILIPEVPVFRDDAGTLLDLPYTLGILTAPAVNAGAVRKNETENTPQIWPTMAGRIAKVLALALHHGYENLVLGAWGCGVFKNDPSEIATIFADALLRSNRFRDRFRHVVFAILDHDFGKPIIEPFRTHFGARIDA